MKAVVLIGPTAVGKTDVALKLVNNRFEIISADSVQVYKYLDIGSSKPTIAERERVRHYLIDIVDPDFPFTAGEFCKRALLACGIIGKNNKIPLFVGGTGLYIDSFFYGLSDIPEIDKKIRDDLYRELDQNGLDYLYNELIRVDYVFGGRISPHDKQRILRGLEVFRGTGNPISSYYNLKKGYVSDQTLFIGLHEDRELLKKRIEKRVDTMVEAGFIDEVRSLRERGYNSELKSMKSIGYAEINRYIDGSMKLEEAVEKIKVETKRYAKRQMTWFKKNKSIHWFKISELKSIHELLDYWFRETQNTIKS